MTTYLRVLPDPEGRCAWCKLPPSLHVPFPQCPPPAEPPGSECVYHCGLCGTTDVHDDDLLITVEGVYHRATLTVCEGCRARPISDLAGYLFRGAEFGPFPPV
jgi:hypothetical protein